jgi:hypothetical protein
LTDGRHLLETPDRHYTVVGGILWRRTKLRLLEKERKRFMSELISARSAVKVAAGVDERVRAARKAVDAAKIVVESGGQG